MSRGTRQVHARYSLGTKLRLLGALRVRVVYSGTRREYVPVGSTAASLPPTIPEYTTRTHFTGSTCLGLLRKRAIPFTGLTPRCCVGGRELFEGLEMA